MYVHDIFGHIDTDANLFFKIAYFQFCPPEYTDDEPQWWRVDFQYGIQYTISKIVINNRLLFNFEHNFKMQWPLGKL